MNATADMITSRETACSHTALRLRLRLRLHFKYFRVTTVVALSLICHTSFKSVIGCRTIRALIANEADAQTRLEARF